MTNSLCFFVLQAKLKAYADLEAKYEKEHNDLKAKRTEYNTIKSSYTRLQIESKDMRDKVREHERVKPKKYWEQGIIEYYRKHPKGRGNKLVLAEDLDDRALGRLDCCLLRRVPRALICSILGR